jgi:signal transduction histidine kinase/ActR/RegA family two-component response regulator
MRLWHGETTVVAIEVRGLRKDGAVIWLEVSSSLIRDEASRPGSFIVVVQDVTARRRAEEEIRRLNEVLEERIAQRTSELKAANGELLAAKEEAEKANHAKNEFLSRTSHELRTPLNAVVGFAQLLLRKPLPDDDRECAEQILMGGEHLIRLIDDLLDISRIEAGQWNVALQPTSPAVVLREAATLMESQATRMEVDIELDEDSLSSRKVLADPQRLRQAMLNILSNAVKYNIRGGKVIVQGGASPTGFRISIRDTGRGIDPAKMHRLFEPFNRLGAEQSEIEGTGLGLTLSKCLIEEMGGALAVQSSPGVGSTFLIDLRMAPNDSKSAADARPCATVGAATGRVLTIDDDPTNRRLLHRILEQELHLTSIAAGSGAEGIRMAQDEPPDLILLDLHLPDMHGDQVLGTLRNCPTTSPIPVIVVSGDVTTAAREEATRQGASAFVAKPYSISELMDAIRSFLATSQSGGSVRLETLGDDR